MGEAVDHLKWHISQIHEVLKHSADVKKKTNKQPTRKKPWQDLCLARFSGRKLTESQSIPFVSFWKALNSQQMFMEERIKRWRAPSPRGWSVNCTEDEMFCPACGPFRIQVLLMRKQRTQCWSRAYHSSEADSSSSHGGLKTALTPEPSQEAQASPPKTAWKMHRTRCSCGAP